MTFSTLMVHLDLEPSNDARLQIAGELAERFDAKLIGIAAANPQPAFTRTAASRRAWSRRSEARSRTGWRK